METPLQFLKGVGPKLGDLFARKGLRTFQDLLEHYPRAFEDQRAGRNIASLQADELVSLKVQIVNVQSITMGRTGRRMHLVNMKDDSGQVQAKYFRVPYKGYFDRLQPFKMVRLVGKVTDFRGRIEFHHPDIKDIEEGEEIQDKIIPIYSEMEGFSSHKIHKMILTLLKQIAETDWPPEVLPRVLLEKYSLISKKEALWRLHDPPSGAVQDMLKGTSSAHRRIIFEEFFWLELYLAARKSGFTAAQGVVISNRSSLPSKLRQSIPFTLTAAQDRVISEIEKDLGSGAPMYRLVQGDVGSGKTMVSFMAVASVVGAGFQCCLMVPTEILAEQHFLNARRTLEPLGVRCALLSGKTKTTERRELFEKLQMGQVDLLIGTHALIEETVQFRKLALVIIDEQHRFGVEQRGLLKNKGGTPHFLVMTATPIPRTLAMTVYGDLDISIIDQLPAGRTPIQTRVIGDSKRDQALKFLEDHLIQGRQAYVVYPLVAESEKLDLKNAVDEFEKLKIRFPKFQVELLHGKLNPVQKEEIMNQFRNAHFQILVSTTVIEVGVDVPNANFMLIEHAERFGLSQLHQLRGRVGRGEHKSYCILILGSAVSEEARQRTEMMEKSNDGFKIAEFDLEMRGPGDLLGTQQSGLAGFKMANLIRDVEVLSQARNAAFEILEKDPQLRKIENKGLREVLLRNHGPIALAGIA